MDKHAVILAGGLGTRLGPLAEGLPKSMVPIGGRPFLDYLVAQLAGQGFRRLLLLVGYRADAVVARFGDGSAWGLEIVYSREISPLGTGGALRLAADLLPERFLLLYGDLYRDYPYGDFLDRRAGNWLAVYPYIPGLATIACANVGIQGDRVRAYLKNRPGAGLTHVDAGFGAFTRDIAGILPPGVSSLEDCVYPVLAQEGRLGAEPVDRNFFDIGNPKDLADTQARLPKL